MTYTDVYIINAVLTWLRRCS